MIQRNIITSIKNSLVAIAGICLKDSYVCITQQDASHIDKVLGNIEVHVKDYYFCKPAIIKLAFNTGNVMVMHW
jgi:hypothetical protein